VSAKGVEDAGTASSLGSEAVPAERRQRCLGNACPTDDQIEAGWVCECGHGWDPHEVEYNGRFVLGVCHICERNAQPTVLEVRCAREPLRAP
jgi:hypothetical protein